MGTGIILALSATFIWGLIFIVPGFMEGSSPIEITIGRYLSYSALSIPLFLYQRKTLRYSFSLWKRAFFFSLMSTVGYYIFVILGIRFSSSAICVLILGTSPITTAWYANMRKKEVSFQKLTFSSLLMLVGLVFVNIPYLEANISLSSYALGILSTIISLILWSAYIIINADFFQKESSINPQSWSTVIGVATFPWVLLFMLFSSLFFKEELSFEKYMTFNEVSLRFLIGSLILGVACSWVGSFLWNKATTLLSTVILGQLTIFETIFGVLFVYIVEGRMPAAIELSGIALLLTAIFLVIPYKSESQDFS